MDATIELNKLVRKRAGKKPKAVWALRWIGLDGRYHCETIGDCAIVSKRDAESIRRRRQGGDKKLLEARSRMRGRGMMFGELRDCYAERRRQGSSGRGHLRGSPRLDARTIERHMMTLRYLIARFGDRRAAGSITIADAEGFVVALEAGELSSARKATTKLGRKLKRTYGMSPQTVRGHIRNAKALFSWGDRFGLVTGNPFSDFEGKPLPTGPNYYVALEDFEKLVKAAPTTGWRAFYGLQRLAGLRRGEALELPWSGKAVDSQGAEAWVGVDWETRRLHVLGNAKAVRRFREVPICPRLHELLLAAYSEAPDGSVTIAGLTEHNLTRLGAAHVKAAGLTPWPKLYQALRSSCENDWKSKAVAEPTYAAWMGHSPTVSRMSYVAPLAPEFEAITGRFTTRTPRAEGSEG